MLTTSIGKLKLALLVSFLILWGGMYAYFNNNYSTKKTLHLTKEVSVITTIYNSSIELFRLSSRPLVEGVIQNENVLRTVAAGINSSGEEQEQARQKLYSQLRPVYEQLRDQGLVLLHFHTPDLKSFLRFHKPDLHGDSLREVRPSVEIANSYKRIVEGFEFGRIKSGYRNIFPLTYQNQHIGSVELSVSFDEIRDKMDEMDSARSYQLIINRDVAFGVLFEQWKDQYPTSMINTDYVIDKSLSVGNHAANGAHNNDKLLVALSEYPKVQTEMKTNRPFSVAVEADGRDWTVTFIPVWDIKHRKAGYLVSYEESLFMTMLGKSFRNSVILGTLFLLVLFFVARLLIRSTDTLISQKNHLEVINDTIGDGLYVMDERGAVTHVNATFTEILGYRPEEIIGKIGHDIFHAHQGEEETQPLKECPIYKSLQNGWIFEGEELFTHKNGSLALVEITSKSFRHISGKKYSVSAFRDITDRKEKEQAIEAEKLRFNSLLESTQDGYWLINAYGEILDVNESYCQMSGYSEQELIGRKIAFVEMAHSDEMIRDNIAMVKQQGKASFEAKHRRKSGEEFDVDVSVSYADIEGGRFFALIRDISQRKKNYEKIEQQKRELEAVFNYSQSGIALVDLEFNVLEFNDAFCKGLGFHREELLNMSLLELRFVEDDDGTSIEDQMKALFSGGAVNDVTKTCHRKDGTIVHTILSAVILPDNERILLNVKDITLMKELEEQLQKLAETDRLTNISNRQKLEFELKKYTELSNRMGLPLGLIMLDLDHFKAVNDEYGHDVGDQVLILVADLIQQHIRVSDIFARWGGEEFMILLPGVDAEHVDEASEKLRVLIEQQDFSPVEQLTSSFGTTTYKAEEDIAEFLKRVDIALYEAKNAGRNRVCRK
ncbi:PAS domain S-box protein [Vibrio sp. JC009]|uniref:PAS domain S-box protein n=1 Tax=Vibrio sp. JC009 TaxID=2912314 RepID=UPI0023AE8DAF|nr:PAS domain S-box protein [Vibrio sp. JC009]WED20850.1 PAS domain S-box protein [Vibrio sp. JC009]